MFKIEQKDIERFWFKVEKTKKCWNWKAGLFNFRYGAFKLKTGQKIRAHRFSYFLKYGNIPKNLFVCHHCDNPKCVRPSHLYLGTKKQNAHDAVIRNRYCRGEFHKSSKLLSTQIKQIRLFYKRGFTLQKIANNFHIHCSHVWRIINKKNWNHVV